MSVDELVAVAKEENWDKVDEVLPNICEDDSFVSWAINKGLSDKDGNVRDLAASILEKTTSSKFENAKVYLSKIMGSDDNPYVRFRASFALYSHGDRSSEVMKTLEEAKKDEDVADIAKDYLARK